MVACVVGQHMSSAFQLRKVRSRSAFRFIRHAAHAVPDAVIHSEAPQDAALLGINEDPQTHSGAPNLPAGEPHALLDERIAGDFTAVQARANPVDLWGVPHDCASAGLNPLIRTDLAAGQFLTGDFGVCTGGGFKGTAAWAFCSEAFLLAR